MSRFWVVRDGERVGPFDEEEVLRSYESGALHGDDLLVAEFGGAGATVSEVFDQLRRDILTSPDLTLEDLGPAPVAAPTALEPEAEPVAPRRRPLGPRFWIVAGAIAAAAVAVLLMMVF